MVVAESAASPRRQVAVDSVAADGRHQSGVSRSEGYEAGDRLFVAVTQEWPADRYKGQPALVAQMKDRAYWEVVVEGDRVRSVWVGYLPSVEAAYSRRSGRRAARGS